jgi:hypothetical protein
VLDTYIHLAGMSVRERRLSINSSAKQRTRRSLSHFPLARQKLSIM